MQLKKIGLSEPTHLLLLVRRIRNTYLVNWSKVFVAREILMVTGGSNLAKRPRNQFSVLDSTNWRDYFRGWRCPSDTRGEWLVVDSWIENVRDKEMRIWRRWLINSENKSDSGRQTAAVTGRSPGSDDDIMQCGWWWQTCKGKEGEGRGFAMRNASHLLNKGEFYW